MDGTLTPPALASAGLATGVLTNPAPAARPRAGADDKAVAKAAGEFESQFVSQMLSQMWQGIETDGYFGGGNGEEMFRGLMINEYGKMITQSGRLGIADQVKQAMLKMQEV
ncbi:rod-binding protein [Skermanella sp. TT6]|uniref:Rod-binding protein n=1 Tax=Skermanella cutis TaxID=2775420 RepID=A0ABX7B3X9_9PROT|nr:rod-binding protein [Skermanella sp. TT6]QQP88834.1 rod-binding protein [Skermanella sp. TT6]